MDNTFNLRWSYAASLCDSIVDAGLEIEWQCSLYPAFMDEWLIEKMARPDAGPQA